jgi:membrane protein implicated in regulation of membrane protease activity
MRVLLGWVLAIIIAFVLVAGGALLFQARVCPVAFSAAYQLVIIDTWAESVVAIVTAIIAYVVGDRTAKTLDNRNRLKYGSSKGIQDLEKLNLNKL